MSAEYCIPLDPETTVIGDELKLQAQKCGAIKNIYHELIPLPLREQIFLMRMDMKRRLERPQQLVRYCGIEAKFNIPSAIARESTVKLGHEQQTLKEFLEAIPEKGPCEIWDIGAAFGLYSIFAALKNPQVQVHAFEPDPAIAEELRKNLKLNQLTNVTVHELALSNTDGDNMLYSDGIAGFAPSLMPTKSYKHSIQVQTTTAGNLCSRLPIPNIIKIDTEGAEWVIFDGSKNLLQADCHPSHLFVEMHPTMDDMFGEVNGMIWSQILSNGYRMHSVYLRDKNLLCHAVSNR